MLKYNVESLEGLEEPIAALYEQGDKGYTLKVDGVVPESRFNEVNQRAVTAADEAKRRRGTVERVLGKLGLEDASGLDDALQALIDGKGKASADQEAIIAQVKGEAQKQVEAAQSALRNMATGSARSALKSAILEAGFHPEIADDIAASAMARVKVDSDGTAVIMTQEGTPLAGSGADGHATFADLAKKLAAEKPSFLVDRGKSGAGSSTAGGNAKKSKTVSRTAFDAMSQMDRAEFSKSGGKVVDG